MSSSDSSDDERNWTAAQRMRRQRGQRGQSEALKSGREKEMAEYTRFRQEGGQHKEVSVVRFFQELDLRCSMCDSFKSWEFQ